MSIFINCNHTKKNHSTLHRLHALHVCSLENCTDCTQNDQNFHFNLAKWPITMNYHRFRSLFHSLFSLNSRIAIALTLKIRLQPTIQCSWKRMYLLKLCHVQLRSKMKDRKKVSWCYFKPKTRTKDSHRLKM